MKEKIQIHEQMDTVNKFLKFQFLKWLNLSDMFLNVGKIA